MSRCVVFLFCQTRLEVKGHYIEIGVPYMQANLKKSDYKVWADIGRNKSKVKKNSK